jgi:hypothetical protein
MYQAERVDILSAGGSAAKEGGVGAKAAAAKRPSPATRGIAKTKSISKPGGSLFAILAMQKRARK